jgi:hypothetical protein
MLTVVGLTEKGNKVAANPANPRTPAFQVVSFLYKNNGQTSKDTLCRYLFGGDINATNRVLKDLKSSHLVAEE